MKIKRLLSFALASLMIVGAAFTTGCQKKEEEVDEDTSSKKTVTLNMFIITEEGTTEEAAKDVQLAINEITLSKYKTKIKINYLTEDEYWDAVDKAEAETIAFQNSPKAAELIAESEAEEKADKAKANSDGEDGKTSDKKTDGEELTDEEEMANLDMEYDALHEQGDILLENPQIDIVLVNSYDKYIELIDDGRLAPLDTYLSLDSKILSSYIYPAFLEAAKINGATYGIPVNGPIGSVEYIIFNKELLDKYGYKAEDMTTLEALEPYLNTIKANEPGVIPLGGAGMHLGYDAYGSEYGTTGIPASDGIVSEEIISIYDQPDVKAHYQKINEYQKRGLLVSDEAAKEGKTVAVDFRKGNTASIAKWEEEDGCEYDYVTYRAPAANNDDLLGSVFAISAYSLNKERAMEMIKLFNINSRLANLLQWGIEGTNYELNSEKGGIDLLRTDYKMNTKYTGNRYIKYRLSSEPDMLEAWKAQNLGVKLSAFYGYSFSFPATVEGDTKDAYAQNVITSSGKIAEENLAELLTGEGSFDTQWSAFMRKINSAYRGRVYDVQLETKLTVKSYYTPKVNALVDSLAGSADVDTFIAEVKSGMEELFGVPGYDEEALDGVLTAKIKERYADDRAGFVDAVKTAFGRLTDVFIDNFTATFDRGYYVTGTNEIIDELLASDEYADAVDALPTEDETPAADDKADTAETADTADTTAEDTADTTDETTDETADTAADTAEEQEEPVVPTPVADGFIEALKAELAPLYGYYYTDEFAGDIDLAFTSEVRQLFTTDKDAFAMTAREIFVSITENIGYDYTYESVRPLIEAKYSETFPNDAERIANTIDNNLTAGGIDVFRINFMLAQFSGYAKSQNEKIAAELAADGNTAAGDETAVDETAGDGETSAEGDATADEETTAEDDAAADGETTAEGETDAEGDTAETASEAA